MKRTREQWLAAVIKKLGREPQGQWERDALRDWYDDGWSVEEAAGSIPFGPNADE